MTTKPSFKFIRKIFYAGVVLIGVVLMSRGGLLKYQSQELRDALPVSFRYLAQGAPFESSLDQNKLKSFQDYYRSLVKVNPDSADAYHFLGYTLFYSLEINRSIKAFEKSVQKNDGLFWAQYNLCVIYSRIGDIGKTIPACLAAIQISPQRAVTAMMASELYSEIILSFQGEPVDIAFRLKQAHLEAYSCLIDALWMQENYDEALKFSQQAIDAGLDDKGQFSFSGGWAARMSGVDGRAANLWAQAAERGQPISNSLRRPDEIWRENDHLPVRIF